MFQLNKERNKMKLSCKKEYLTPLQIVNQNKIFWERINKYHLKNQLKI